MFVQFYYTKQPMFWLPKGFLPYYAEWLLSFPRAPLGSVSVQSWGLACGAVILLVNDAIVAAIGLAMNMKSKPVQQKTPMKHTGEKSSAAADNKKEL
jgi:hypothetical protein